MVDRKYLMPGSDEFVEANETLKDKVLSLFRKTSYIVCSLLTLGAQERSEKE